ncbi:MAG: Asp-tRNA(Asn)/Glu-tRNA(Gln) amidotransferase subunit GatA [Deltaproteobacteria bacterium]|jgi:aspartyl-tRNA(Asn)/glutamyl-tRNA(Gln) amidotransferase subunit A|nr:Asp-tRNA(Asn)/Glu-tRNA(Gln) amidotransferase subunit GatA [Deltaproteobacteria bacterium]
MELCQLTAYQLHEMLMRKEVTSREITESVLKRIAKVEDRIHAFITLTPDVARQQAALADARIQKGETTPLTGIPLAIKDLICTQGVRTTCGSHILENYIPPYDATVIEKLKAAGAVLVGKANMDEFAMGSSTENSFFGPTRNPWDLERIPGGSSGGAAAAVAAGECIASLGSDTGGSIRQPASCCGVVGIKPTYGRVSRYGLVAFASSLDQIGPFSKDVRDAALLLQAICGHDFRDSTSVNVPVPDFTQSLVDNVRGMILGIPKECFREGLDPEVESAFREAVRNLEKLGAKTVEVSLPHSEYALAVYYIIAPAEASSNLARYDGVKYGFRAKGSFDLMEMYKETRSQGFGAEVKRRIMLGTYALSAGYYEAYYRKAAQVRTLVRQDFEKTFAHCDVLLTPTAPTPAFKLGEKVDDPLQMYLSDIFTIPCNLAGLPGLSLPSGFSKQGLPIGLQILANHFQEEKMLRAAYVYEQNTEYHLRQPAL